MFVLFLLLAFHSIDLPRIFECVSEREVRGSGLNERKWFNGMVRISSFGFCLIQIVSPSKYKMDYAKQESTWSHLICNQKFRSIAMPWCGKMKPNIFSSSSIEQQSLPNFIQFRSKKKIFYQFQINALYNFIYGNDTYASAASTSHSIYIMHTQHQ